MEKNSPPQPDPGIRKQFLQAVDDAQNRARSGAEDSIRTTADALFACAWSGDLTDYMALVEKRQISSLSPAKRSNTYAQRLLKLDPKFYDAYLTAGFSEYMVGSLPFFIRWFVHFDNVNGDKERGVQQPRAGGARGPLFQAVRQDSAGNHRPPQEETGPGTKDSAGAVSAPLSAQSAFPQGTG